MVEVIDSVEEYLNLMKEIFDFNTLKDLIQGGNKKPPFKVLINSMHGGEFSSYTAYCLLIAPIVVNLSFFKAAICFSIF